MEDIGFNKAFHLAAFLRMEGLATYRVDPLRHHGVVGEGNSLTITLTPKGEKEFSNVEEAVEYAEETLRGESSIEIQSGELSDFYDYKSKLTK